MVPEVTTPLRAIDPTGVPGQYSSYGPLVLVGAVVEVVEPGVVVVVVVVPPPPLATAMTGLIGLPVGGVVVMPEGAELFG
jgi:hypothetical protein